MFSATLRGVRTQGPGLTMSGITDDSLHTRSTPAPVSLPDRSTTAMLSTAYFDQVHPQFPFLHQPTYLQWEEEVMIARESGYAPNPAHLFFVYAVTAVGALIGPFSGAKLHEGLYASAESLFERVMQLNSLESIQAILCCAMYSIRSPVGVSVWTLSGLALRQCIELGLHRKIPWSKVESDVLKSQMRRRVFWCSYNLDRAAAVTLGRPVGIADSDINVEFPFDINDENITISGLLAEPRTNKEDPATTISSAIHTIRIRQIWARIQSMMESQVGPSSLGPNNAMIIESFKRELTAWLESAPQQLSANQLYNNNYASSEWFEIMYHHSILLLYRHRLVHPSQHLNQKGNRNHGSMSSSIYVECASAAHSICHLYRRLYVTQRLNDTWGALHVLFLGGCTFLHCLWISEETRSLYRLDKVAATCTACMVVLAVMSERWHAVEAYRDAFDMLSTATQAMLAERVATLTPPAMPVLSASVNDQLSDHLSHIAEIGMCPSVEALLAEMID